MTPDYDVTTFETWRLKAEEDFTAASILVEHGGPAATICFLCQQVAEKYLKGYLLLRRQRSHRGHDRSVTSARFRAGPGANALTRRICLPHTATVHKVHTPPARWVTTKENQVGGRIGPRRRELRAAQRMAISARIGRPSRVPQLTPAPLAITSPSSTARPGEKCWPASMRIPRRNIERPAISPLRRSWHPITGRNDNAR